MTIRLMLLAGAALALSGCGVARQQNSCSDQHSSYVGMWDCIKRSGVVPGDSSGIRYKAMGDALAEQVGQGKITDLQAKAALAGELDMAEQNHRGRNRRFTTTCNSSGNTLICN